jgi:hypothetical protein
MIDEVEPHPMAPSSTTPRMSSPASTCHSGLSGSTSHCVPEIRSGETRIPLEDSPIPQPENSFLRATEDNINSCSSQSSKDETPHDLELSPKSLARQQQVFWDEYAACPQEPWEFEYMDKEFHRLFDHANVQVQHGDTSDSSDGLNLSDNTKKLIADL